MMKQTISALRKSEFMKSKFSALIALSALALAMFGCGGGAKTTTDNSSGSKTGNNNQTSSKKAEKPKPKTEIPNKKKPEGEGKTANKKVPVPADWVYVYDENKGYGFAVPSGSSGDAANVEGIDVFVAGTPAPSEVAVFVLAYKDKTRTKEELLGDAVKFLEGMGETVQAGSLTAESDIYSLAEATTTNAEGGKSKMKILVGTDVTDNYVMIVGTDESKFEANKEIVDAIWGSFEIWSGGAS